MYTKNRQMPIQRIKHSRSIRQGVVVYDDDIDYPSFCRKRNVEIAPGYNEYCELWRYFIDLKTGVRWRNKPTNYTYQPPYDIKLAADNQPKAGPAKFYIPRIQSLITDTERAKKDAQDTINRYKSEINANKIVLLAETDNAKKIKLQTYIDSLERYLDVLEKQNIIDQKKRDKLVEEYKAYENVQVALWMEMDALIKLLADNEYVKNRNYDVDEGIRGYNLEDYKGALYEMIDY